MNSTAQAPGRGYLTPVFLGSGAFVFLNFGLPIRADDLGVSAMAIGGMYTVFTGTMLLVRPLIGYLLDRVGRRWFFSVAFLFYTLSMSVLATSEGLADFYLARFLQGIAASLMWVTARTMIADLHESHGRGAAMGQLTTTSVRGSLLGALYGFTLLGLLPMREAWLWAFAGYAVAALLAFGWSLFSVAETRTPTAERPDLETIHNTALRKALIVIFLSAFASALIEPVYLIFLKQKFQLDVRLLALAFLPAGIVFAILPRYTGRWSDRWGRGKLISLGVSFAGVVSILLPLWGSMVMVAVFYILFAVGWAMASPAEEALIADLAPAHQRGSVIGLKEGVAGAGAALGPLGGGYVYDNFANELAFVINGAMLLLTAGLALLWFRHDSHQMKTRGVK